MWSRGASLHRGPSDLAVTDSEHARSNVLPQEAGGPPGNRTRTPGSRASASKADASAVPPEALRPGMKHARPPHASGSLPRPVSSRRTRQKPHHRGNAPAAPFACYEDTEPLHAARGPKRRNTPAAESSWEILAPDAGARGPLLRRPRRAPQGRSARALCRGRGPRHRRHARRGLHRRSTEVQKHGFSVITTGEAESLPGSERQKQMLAAASRRASQKSPAREADIVATGSVGKVGETYELTRKALDARTANVVGRASETAAKVDDLFALVRSATPRGFQSRLLPPAPSGAAPVGTWTLPAPVVAIDDRQLPACQDGSGASTAVLGQVAAMIRARRQPPPRRRRLQPHPPVRAAASIGRVSLGPGPSGSRLRGHALVAKTPPFLPRRRLAGRLQAGASGRRGGSVRARIP